MERSKKLNILLISYLAFAICVAIACASLASAVLSRYESLEENAYRELEALRNSASVSGSGEKTGSFILREESGKIGVFSGDGKLLETLEVNIKTLPAKDREMLKAGIPVSSREELNSLIQDYTS